MTPREGTTVADRYRLVRKVGGGPVAAIWRVHDEVTETKGALKILSPAMHRHPEALTRFSLEERISRELSGPYFAERIGSGNWQSMRYIAWKWHEGETLRSLMERNQQLDVATVNSVLTEASTALSMAHQLGYAHADVKPENLYFADARPGEARQLKLFGFGIAARAPGARSARSSPGRRRPGQILGTPLYMCPQTVMGYLPGDAQADVWALGAIAYETLVGRPPFLGASESDVFRAILDRQAPSPCSLATLPPAIDLWWERVLGQQFLTAEQLVSDLSVALGPMLRSSHTQRSAMALGTPFSPKATAARTAIVDPTPAPAPPLEGSNELHFDNQLFSQTVSGTGDSNPLAAALLALRQEPEAAVEPSAPPIHPQRRSSASPPADNPFVPCENSPGSFRVDARKTLVGLTPHLLTPAPRVPSPPKPSESTSSDSTLVGLEPRSTNPTQQAFDSITPRPVAEVLGTMEPAEDPASPTLPFPTPALVSSASRVEQEAPESPRSPTLVLQSPPTEKIPRAGFLTDTLTGSRTLQLLFAQGDHRAQWIAAGVVCTAAALLMAALGLSAASGTADLERASIASQPQPIAPNRPDARGNPSETEPFLERQPFPTESEHQPNAPARETGARTSPDDFTRAPPAGNSPPQAAAARLPLPTKPATPTPAETRTPRPPPSAAPPATRPQAPAPPSDEFDFGI